MGKYERPGMIKYRTSILDHAYKFSIRIYKIPIINENHLIIENRANLLSKRWWQRSRERNEQRCDWRLKIPINRDIRDYNNATEGYNIWRIEVTWFFFAKKTKGKKILLTQQRICLFCYSLFASPRISTPLQRGQNN